MNRSRSPRRLLLGTALSVPFATAAFAQSLSDITDEQLSEKSQECQTLAEDFRGMDDPSGVSEGEVFTAVSDDTVEECTRLQEELSAASEQQSDSETQSSESQAETTEQVDLTDEATLEGEAEVTIPEPDVAVDVPAPTVNVTPAPGQVTVSR